MNYIGVEKDELYYDDLAYIIKKYAGILSKRDFQAEKRIETRCHSVDVVINGVRGSVMSEFQLEIFSTIDGILQEAGETTMKFKSISNYPDIVNETINNIKSKSSPTKVNKREKSNNF